MGPDDRGKREGAESTEVLDPEQTQRTLPLRFDGTESLQDGESALVRWYRRERLYGSWWEVAALWVNCGDEEVVVERDRIESIARGPDRYITRSPSGGRTTVLRLYSGEHNEIGLIEGRGTSDALHETIIRLWLGKLHVPGSNPNAA